MEHNVLLVLFIRPLVLGLYKVVNLCFITRRANKLSITSFRNWGSLSKTISSGIPNRIKTRSYKNHATYCFTKDFKVRTFANFMRYSVTTIMNQWPFLVTGSGPIKSIPHFSKGLKGGMGCRGPFTVDLCAYA